MNEEINEKIFKSDNFDTNSEAKQLKKEQKKMVFEKPSFPETWTRDNVTDWLTWCSNEYGLHKVPFNKFEMNGKALCMLTEEMFKQRAPNYGDILYKSLKNLQQGLKNPEKVYSNSVNHSNFESNFNNNNEICSSNTHSDNNNKTAQNNDNTTFSYSEVCSNLDKDEIHSSLDIANMKPQSSSPLNLAMKQKKSCNIINKSDTIKIKPSNLESKENDNCESESAKTSNPVYEKKRTANLENLIGNIKVRKLNQNSNTKGEFYQNEKQLTTLYVDVVSNSRLESNDYSPQSPLLSTPSVSPSSESINPDSPSHTSPTSSSSSSSRNNNKSRYSMINPKFRWMMESAGNSNVENISQDAEIVDKHFQDNKTNEEILESFKKLDSEKIKDLFNKVMPCMYTNKILIDNKDSEYQQSTTENSDVKKNVARFNGKKCINNNVRQLNDPKNTGCNINKSTALNGSIENIANLKYSICPTSKNQEDPTRQIKFYDDFIDFRGDILHRPPDSKNCRILWEYLYLLLQNTDYSSVIRWEDDTQMVFRIVQAEKLAALWGLQKNRLGMTYEKLSRGMRYYYPNNIIAREPGRRLLYRFMRHPSEIKKFVKKNGTYMLKRAKVNDKNSSMDSALLSGDIDDSVSIKDEVSPEDSSIDESFYENPELNVKNNLVKTKKKNTTSYHSKKIHKLINNEQLAVHETDLLYNENEVEDEPELEENNSEHTDEVKKSSTQSPQSSMNPLFSSNPNVYPGLYSAHDMFQYYQAAAAAAASGLPANYFSKISPKDDIGAAQFLTHLRSQNMNANSPSGLVDNGNKFLQETIKKFADSINLQNTNSNLYNSTLTNSGQSQDILVHQKGYQSNDVSSASSTSSTSSKSSSNSKKKYSFETQKSINNLNDNSFNGNYKYNTVTHQNNRNKILATNMEYPLNLSIDNSSGNYDFSNKKRNSPISK